jgi:diguanylate cyclase (GGDEF)-like protein
MRDQHLSFLGNCDPQTGMMNRGRMMEALGRRHVGCGGGTNCAFVLAAINNLSVVNEAYGFEMADQVIINMGRAGSASVVRTGDAIARYSGSKFGLILNNCSEEDLTPQPSVS